MHYSTSGTEQEPNSTPLVAMVLAAGKGTRMNTPGAKCMHTIAGLSMLGHVCRHLAALRPMRTVIVAPAGEQERFEREGQTWLDRVQVIQQHDRLGTGHAARIGLAGFSDLDQARL
ncbi:MAG: NTP transferase domain-containing protein, partial [Pseudomonadota bacterium]